MDPGRLDRRITIRRATTTRDELNHAHQDWSTLATVSAYVEPVSDGERMRAGETLGAKKSRFTIRYSSTVSDVDNRDRLTFDGRDYDINQTKELGRRHYIEITATARAESP